MDPGAPRWQRYQSLILTHEPPYQTENTNCGGWRLTHAFMRLLRHLRTADCISGKWNGLWGKSYPPSSTYTSHADMLDWRVWFWLMGKKKKRPHRWFLVSDEFAVVKIWTREHFSVAVLELHCLSHITFLYLEPFFQHWHDPNAISLAMWKSNKQKLWILFDCGSKKSYWCQLDCFTLFPRSLEWS